MNRFLLHGRAVAPAALLGIVLALGACSAEAPDTDVPSPTPLAGLWDASVTVTGGEIPFTLLFDETSANPTASIINGEETLPVPEVRITGDRLSLEFPAFNTRINARKTATGLAGSLTLVKRYGVTQVLPFQATPTKPVALTDDAPAYSVSGRWATTFTEPEGRQYPAIGEFEQTGSDVTGTFLTETGDYRYLNGQVKGETFEFGTFDGAHAFLFRATLDNNNALQGEFWSGSYPAETWSATRDADVALRDGGALTYLNKGFERLEFSFPDESGTMVSLQDERFTDKVVIVTLVGSWCPNCHDETALLAELYTRYSGEGFEVIALMFEHLEDEDAAWTQINAFRTKFDLQYPTLLAGISEKTQAASKLPALNHILSFPTAIFIDRRGAVRHIHTGFTGPGTGVHYEALRQDTIERIESLLAEPATPTVSRSN